MTAVVVMPGATIIAGAHVLAAEVSAAIQSGVPLLAQDQYQDSRAFVLDSTGMLIMASYSGYGADLLKAGSLSSDAITAESASQVIDGGVSSQLTSQGQVWTDSSWFGLSTAVVKVGDGTLLPKWLMVVAVPNDNYNPSRTPELALFCVVVAGLLLVAVWGYFTNVKLRDRDLGGGLSLLRVISLGVSVVMIAGIYTLWTNTSLETLEKAVNDLVLQVRPSTGTITPRHAIAEHDVTAHHRLGIECPRTYPTSCTNPR